MDIQKEIYSLVVKVEEDIDKAIVSVFNEAAVSGACSQVVFNKTEIIKMIMKNEAKKVVYDNEYYPYCPRCGEGYLLNVIETHKPHHCPNCGQALSWR